MGKMKFSLVQQLKKNCGDQEKWLFFIFEKKSVIKSAKMHNSALNPTLVFVLAPVNAVTHKGP